MAIFNIDAAKALLDGVDGVAAPNRYQVVFSPPAFLLSNPLLGGLGLAAANLIALSAEITEMPGRQIATTPQVIYGAGRKMPYSVVYADLPMTFICTNNMAVRQMFDIWHSYIYNNETFSMNYYDNYVTTISIVKYDEDANPRYITEVREAYPVTLEGQSLNYSENDTYMKFTVQFAYRTWIGYSPGGLINSIF